MRCSQHSRLALQSEDDAQVVLLRDACAAPRPRTSAARSVFEAGTGGQRRRAAHVVAPNPASLQVVDIPAPKRRNPPSPWRAVFDSIPVGRAAHVTEAQALALADWARQNGRRVHRQRVDADTFAVWRDS